MLPKDTPIFVSYHPSDESIVLPMLEQVKAAGWENIVSAESHIENAAISELIQQSGMFVVFLSKVYAHDDRLMLEEFAYASTIVRKPFLPVWLDSLVNIQQDYEATLAELEDKELEDKRQLLSALEMLTAKHPGATAERLTDALAAFEHDMPPYTPSTPQICDKPCEAYEDNEPYIFISYAHDDATRVYPIVKDLFEAGWDLWYDEGIKTTERYLPVIADHVKRASVFVLMLTNRCLERPFVMNYELEFARRCGIPVVPVLLEELNPPDYARGIVDEFMVNAVAPERLLEIIKKFDILKQHGSRKAVPPAIKQNMVYDVVLPPEIQGFEIAVHGDEITITKYIGNEIDVNIPDRITSFDGKMTFRITGIGENAFCECDTMDSINIPNSVKRIGSSAFSFCKSLRNIIIPEGVEVIGDNIFYYCENLENVTLPTSLKKIGKKWFYHCYRLANIAAPEFIKCEEFYGADYCLQPDLSIGYNKWDRDLLFDSYPDLSYDYAGEWNECRDNPFALISCVYDDIPKIDALISSLFWEGFNLQYESNTKSMDRMLDECSCVIMFITEITVKKDYIINLLTSAVNKKIPIIQVYLREYVELPTVIRYKLQGQHSIINANLSEMDYLGQIRSSLRSFNCCLGHPRGFETEKCNDGIKITRFIDETTRRYDDTARNVIIPKTFSNPPLTVKEIGDNAFEKCTLLKSIYIPDCVTYVGVHAFKDCKWLKFIHIPQSVTDIGFGAFENCINIKMISIPDNITKIENRTFRGCSALSLMYIPDTVISIEENAFAGCNNLTIFTPHSSFAWKYAESHNIEHRQSKKRCTFDYDALDVTEEDYTLDSVKKNIKTLRYKDFFITVIYGEISIDHYEGFDENILIPLGITGIGSAFSIQEKLKSVILPNSLKYIWESAFVGCNSLSYINIPYGVQYIGDNAFTMCESLKYIKIPSSVKFIGYGAFTCCPLTSIDIPNSVEYIGEYAFDAEKLTIHTPVGSYAEQYAHKNNIRVINI